MHHPCHIFRCCVAGLLSDSAGVAVTKRVALKFSPSSTRPILIAKKFEGGESGVTFFGEKSQENKTAKIEVLKVPGDSKSIKSLSSFRS